VHSDLLLMLLADARLPVAGHTQSGTLEGALAHGLAPGDVPAFVRSRLATVTLVEAATAVVVRRIGPDATAIDLLAVEAAWAARTPSAPLRDASRGQGRALLRLAGRLWPDAPAVAVARSLPVVSRAVVLGTIADHVNLEPASLARLVGYDDVQTVCAASLKLAPLDPAEVAAWVHEVLPAIDRMAGEVAGIVRAEDIPAPGHPQLEAWAQAHAASTRRLFRA
jgi:urease accessory protein